jgi:hypothetical protein
MIYSGCSFRDISFPNQSCMYRCIYHPPTVSSSITMNITYDIVWYRITVATGGDTGEAIPMLIKVHIILLSPSLLHRIGQPNK